ncbi:MAG: serine protease [Parcubacteria group bacterium]
MTTMEDLTKTQIVLLSLLVSFVSSIATGIITTSLLAEAPVSVTQTINRVVERTIETVAPTPANPTGTIKEVTVVKEEDAILSSIEKVTKSVVRIRVKGGDGVEVFYGLGAIVSKDGLVVTDGEKLAPGMTYAVTLHDGSILPLVPTSLEKSEDGIALFKITPDEGHKEFSAITFAPAAPKLGQSVIAIEGREETAIGVGRVLGLVTRTSADVKITAGISTDIRAQGELVGSPLINLSGQLVGIKVTGKDLTLTPGFYIAHEPIKRLLAQGGL